MSVPVKPFDKDVFQSYQSRQINPDDNATFAAIIAAAEFQSYQSRQINPDMNQTLMIGTLQSCFNRINPNRSIPTMTALLQYLNH